MKKTLSVPIVLSLAAGLLVIGMTGVSQASPHYGGNCGYCHGGDAPNAMEVTGESLIEDGKKVFEIDPGGTADFGLNVVAPGVPTYFRVVLRGLDQLDGGEPEIGSPHYFPRKYTPDPTWQTSGPAPGQQYLFWNGQYYGQGPGFMPTAYNYHLAIDPDVAPGDYGLTAYVAGGFPMRAPGQVPSGGWSYGQDFSLRVTPEPASCLLLMMGLGAFCLFARRRRRIA